MAANGVVKTKPATKKVTLLQLFLLNSAVCGLEFCASAAFTYIPPMLLKAGLPDSHMSFVLGIGPCLGFIFVPMIGHASDHCKSRFGRRRPFILGLSLLLIISLIVVPYGEEFGQRMYNSVIGHKLGVGLLIIGAVALDFTTQATLTPCEALLSDASRNTDHQERAFTVYSFMASIGGIIGYLITAIDWRKTPVGIFFGSQEHACFIMLLILFSITLFLTIYVGNERPISSSNRRPQKRRATSPSDETGVLLPVSDIGYESGSSFGDTDDDAVVDVDSIHLEEKLQSIGAGVTIQPLLVERSFTIPLTRWSVKLSSFYSLIRLIGLRFYRWLPNNVKVLVDMPIVLKRLAMANFFSWTAVMGFNLFFSDYVGQSVYGGNPNAPPDSLLRMLYDEGVRMASWGLLFHCITSAMYAGIVEQLSSMYGMRATYFIGMSSFTLTMIGLICVKSIWLVNIFAALTGIGYATLTTVPFNLLTLYHENKEVYFYDIKSDITRGVGTDMAALDSAYFLSQVMLSAIMGNLVHLTGNVVTYIAVAAAMGAISCLCIGRIVFSRQHASSISVNLK